MNDHESPDRTVHVKDPAQEEHERDPDPVQDSTEEADDHDPTLGGTSDADTSACPHDPADRGYPLIRDAHARPAIPSCASSADVGSRGHGRSDGSCSAPATVDALGSTEMRVTMP